MGKEKAEGYWEIGDKKTNKPTEVIAWLMVEKAKLEEENEKLSEKIGQLEFDVDAWHQLKLLLEGEIEKLKSDLAFERTMLDNVRAEYESLQNVIKKLKETIKDHQLYEEKLEHRIIEFEELLHGE